MNFDNSYDATRRVVHFVIFKPLFTLSSIQQLYAFLFFIKNGAFVPLRIVIFICTQYIHKGAYKIFIYAMEENGYREKTSLYIGA